MPKNTINFSSDILRENCFGFLRLLFALIIFFNHFGALTTSFVPFFSGRDIFFIISGFLLMRSYYKDENIRNFFVKRIRRIVPVYMLIVVVCAVGFSFVSSLSFQEYFSNKDFFRYLAANISFLNFIQPTLPGVFTNNPLPYVNGSLWMIKVLICLYALVPIFALLAKRKPAFLLIIILYVFSFCFVWYMNFLFEKTENNLYKILNRQFLAQLRFFISGVALLFYFDWLKQNRKWLLPISIIVIILKYSFDFQIIEFFHPFAFAIIIISFAYIFSRLKYLTRFGDYSYGIYLFHFPVIQTIIHFGWLQNNPFLMFLFCFGITFFLAGLSWHLLEKRVLKKV